MDIPLAVSVVAILVAVLGIGAVIVLLLRLQASLQAMDPTAEQSAALSLLQGQIDGLRADVSRSLDSQAGLLDRRIAHTTQTVTQRLDSVSRTVSDLRQQMGRAHEASERIFEVGRSIAGLQEILRSPKIRGGLGEHFLGELLGQILPREAFSLQHSFRSGVIVDAVIRAGEHLVPVDAKFPLENFLRMNRASDEADKRVHRKAFISDVRRHIDSIAEKYIRPDEGTFDFALMYVAAENVYYETILRDEPTADGPPAGIFEHAIARKVIPVSPNSLYSYLQVILLGLRGMRIEESARQVLDGLSNIGSELDRFRETFELVGKHLGNASRQHESAVRQLDGVRSGFETLRSLPAGETDGAPREADRPGTLAGRTEPDH